MRGTIYLVGFMAAGKTTAGRILSRELGWKFVDLDRVIEERSGRSIIDIFHAEGETVFRQHEKEILREISTDPGTVVALGGGSFVDPENRKIARDSGICIFLDTPFDEILKRLDGHEDRPLARRQPVELKSLLDARMTSYRDAHFHVPAVGTPDEVVEAILQRLKDMEHSE